MQSSTFVLNETSDDKKSQPLSASTMQCHISPMVVMAVLNHYQRRPSNKQQKKSPKKPQNLYPSFVIGLLFGHKQKGSNSLIINDTFGLETQLDPKNGGVAVSLQNAKKAVELHAMAHPNDRLVGWYRTGLQIETNSTSIHDMIIISQLKPLSDTKSKKAGPELDISEYVHLLVDTALKNDKLTIRAFTTIPVMDPLQEMEYNEYLKQKKRRERAAKQKGGNPNSKSSKARKRRQKAAKKQQQQQQQQNDGNKEDKNKNSDKSQNQSQQQSPSKIEDKTEQKKEEKEQEPLKEVEKPFAIFYRFREITMTYSASESERIGLDMIIESPPEDAALDSPSMLMNDTNHLEEVLKSLLENIDIVENYVHRVINNEIEADESLGWLIGDVLASVPNLSPAKFEQMISNRLQDFLMMVYLGKMTKAQLVIADKINKVLPSTVPGYEADI